jgi:hypothetical protein
LAEWVKAEYDNRPFHFGYSYEKENEPTIRNDGVLLPADNIHEVMRRPLAEQWRKYKYRYEDGKATLAYYSGLDKSPDYFADFARHSATTHNAMLTLLGNQSPHVPALFRTLLNRWSLHEVFQRQIHLYPNKIKRFSEVDNPLVEADWREYIIRALSDPKHNASSSASVNIAVSSAVFGRIDRESIDKDEFAAWVASLPINQSSKNLALRLLRLRQDEAQTFADRLQQTAGQRVLIDTDLTLDDFTKWFDENPEGNLFKFIEEHEEDIVVTEVQDRRGMYDYSSLSFFALDSFSHSFGRMDYYQQQFNLPEGIVLTLLRSDTLEGDSQVQDLIRRIWKHTPQLIEGAIATDYTSVNLRRDGGEHSGRHFYDAGSNSVPEYILDLYLAEVPKKEAETSDKAVAVLGIPGASGVMPGILALCDSPKSKEILEKWIGEATAIAKPRLERCLEIWKARSNLRATKMEIFQELLSGKISPDDLLYPEPAWKWKDGAYVQGE